MMRTPYGNPNRPPPLLDSGEQTRVDYWKDRTEVLPRELLEITGWPGRAGEGETNPGPEREVAADQEGQRVAVRATEARNAVFRIPLEGPVRERWQEYLGYLRKEQQNRWLKEELLAEAVAEEKAAREELTRCHEAVTKAEAELAASRTAGGAPSSQGEVERRTSELRRRVSDRGLAQGRWERVAAEVRWRQSRAATPRYVGLHGEINAFLDLQALSVARLASEELRRRPRPILPPLLVESEPIVEEDR
jgi:hypothetical protein